MLYQIHETQYLILTKSCNEPTWFYTALWGQRFISVVHGVTGGNQVQVQTPEDVLFLLYYTIWMLCRILPQA